MTTPVCSKRCDRFVTLMLFRMDLNIYAFVGMIMLVGIVEKNAIMQIDFALDAERGGKKPEEAIYEGCLIRFRPIMMTTMAALLGAVPIALGYGAGGEARQPLGLVVVGGLLFSQLVTLYLTPVFYTYMAQLQTWMRSRQRAASLRPATLNGRAGHAATLVLSLSKDELTVRQVHPERDAHPSTSSG